MSKFSKISLALALAISVASPAFAIDDVFDPLADLYSELEEKADPSTAVEPESAVKRTSPDNYLSELEKMAARMEAAAAGETAEPATEPATVEPVKNNSIEPATGAKISTAGGAIEDAVTPPAETAGTVAATTPKTTTPLIAGGNVGSEVFVFAYDGSAVAHSSNELTAAGPAAVALFALAGGLAGAYFFRRKILNV